MCWPSLFFCSACILNAPPQQQNSHYPPCSGAPLPWLNYSSAVIQPSISPPPPPFSHANMQLALTCGSAGERGIYSSTSPPLEPVLTLHWGHFWAFLCPCSMTLAQVRSSLSPFLYCRHFSPLCHGAWHLKHHTNWQLLHWICKMESEAYAFL